MAWMDTNRIIDNIRDTAFKIFLFEGFIYLISWDILIICKSSKSLNYEHH